MHGRPTHPRRRAAFTLIELILVLMIIAVLSAVVFPTLWAFAAGRRGGDAAVTVVTMANYAHSQAISTGAAYRLNFDAQARQVWVTVQRSGAFVPPSDEYADRFTLPEGVRMVAQVTPSNVSVPIARPDVQQSNDAAPPPFGAPPGTLNTLVQVAHDGSGTYVEFGPGGRCDPCLIRLTDAQGYTVNIGSAAATDMVHVLKPGEM